ncbi:hypothetical protein [Eubacterium sp. MSJ-33]|uniref:hypothetical protein n=1 Tax=Eubacterium sp. MSJ-33 TaxID=2841528 RepID=UPI001C78138B|nr:hypothetical protein [Eubacterium sp. MSJ-33]QWT53151.1 hypothetical protein KP625_00530 [Eubacterium sp. MSJ-33]
MCKGKKSGLRIDMVHGEIVMNASFAKQAEIFGTYEYECLQEARTAYHEYSVVRRQIKKNSSQQRYKGLNYDFMRDYIWTHEPVEERLKVLDGFEDLVIRTKCHSAAFRYPYVKRWFLNRYPEVATLEFRTIGQENAAAAAFSLESSREGTAA